MNTDEMECAYYVHMFRHRRMRRHRPKWRGVLLAKYPSDMLMYHQIVWESRPDIIIECGTSYGGSALFFADTLDMIGKGRVITIDVTRRGEPPTHPRVTHLLGSSVAPEIVSQVRGSILPQDKVMVILDSDHSSRHVLEELAAYSNMVTPGMYLVVEDTILNNHPAPSKCTSGPFEAVEAFMHTHSDEYEQMPHGQEIMFSQQSAGWLRKKTATNGDKA